MNKRLRINFSGGRTSAFMLNRLLADHRHYDEICVVFANTGLEDERTLNFVDRVDREWNANVVWLEAVVHPEFGVGTTHRVVNFETASRKGEPFEKAIAKYGIPNQTWGICNRELKQRPMDSYSRSIGWEHFDRAIGIRADEPDRIRQFFYPLATVWPTEKWEINDFWKQQDFDLGLKEHEGNCRACWKKSDKKLVKIMQEQPDAFDFFERMEGLHGHTGQPSRDGLPRRFFRKFRTVSDFRGMANLLHSSDQLVMFSDENDGCSESCEAD